jgi:hypothetical protein
MDDKIESVSPTAFCAALIQSGGVHRSMADGVEINGNVMQASL